MIDYTGIPEALHERIKFIRLKYDFKQEDIAQILNISRVTYTKYETGDRTIPTEVIIVLAKTYSLTTDFILGISAKPEHVDYGDFLIGLSDKAMQNLYFIFEKSQNAFKALHKILESEYSFKMFEFLGLLMQTPSNISVDDFKCNEDISEAILHEYAEDSEMEIPTGMFDMGEAEAMALGKLKLDVAYEAYFNVYMKKIIDDIRNNPETKKKFVGELMKKYYEDVKSEYDEMPNESEEEYKPQWLQRLD